MKDHNGEISILFLREKKLISKEKNPVPWFFLEKKSLIYPGFQMCATTLSRDVSSRMRKISRFFTDT